MKPLRRRMWVHPPQIWESGWLERALDDLMDMGVEEALLLVCGGEGACFPSCIRPQHPSYEGKNIVQPFVKEAERRGLKVRAWVITLNLPNGRFVEAHRDWYVVNELGVSCVDNLPTSQAINGFVPLKAR